MSANQTQDPKFSPWMSRFVSKARAAGLEARVEQPYPNQVLVHVKDPAMLAGLLVSQFEGNPWRHLARMSTSHTGEYKPVTLRRAFTQLGFYAEYREQHPEA